MRADNSHHLIAAARHRAAATRKRAIAALRRMDKAGTPITFDALAKEAKVSRSWLYNQPDLRDEVEHLRTRRNPTPNGRQVPDRQRASDASLLRRLESAAERIKRLEADNQQLREALALALGERRTTAVLGGIHDTPRKKSAPLIGPC
jgi:hypothetical protein